MALRTKGRHRVTPLGVEVRHFAPTGLEVRERANTNEIIITGKPIVYGLSYRVVDAVGEFEEIIHPGAASDLLASGVDCRLLLNHEGLPMARTTAKTLRLWDTPQALCFEARLDARQQLANDFAIAIERGDVSQMSVGMIVGKDKWSTRGQSEVRDIFRLRDLLDVSGVTYPCSPTTSIEVAQRMALAIPVESRARLRRDLADACRGKPLPPSTANALRALLDGDGAPARASVLADMQAPVPAPRPAVHHSETLELLRERAARKESKAVSRARRLAARGY